MINLLKSQMKNKNLLYGKELIIDLHNCNVSKFNRKEIDKYFRQLCKLIKMKRCERYWWDDVGVPDEEKQTEPHLKGTSAVQFIMTSNITIHTLDLLGNAYINIFSCKDFDSELAREFTRTYFEGTLKHWEIVKRV
jgi:S-adenosylmethionine decarboxylase